MKRLTNQEFLNKLYEIKGNEYTPLDEYNGARTKIRFRHNTCGRVFETTPDNIYRGGCPECGYENMRTKQRKNNKEFLEEVRSLVNDEYTFIDYYVNNTTKLKVVHNKCGHEYKVTPRDFLSGRRCPNCKNKRISKSNTLTNDEFMKMLNKVLEPEYKVLNEYKNAKTKLKVKHEKCGLIYKAAPHKLLNGRRCPVCVFKDMGEKRSKPHNVFVEEVNETVGKEYEVLGEYKNNRTKILMKHIKCGDEFYITPDSFLRGSGCPKCKESWGEKEITKILKKYKILNIPQYKFDDCIYKDKLRFDFALIKNNKVICLVEYQGIQHYEPVDIFGGEEIFLIQQEKDCIKRQYANNNKIPLIEIPYHIENIEKFLIDEITKLIPR